MNDVSNVGGVVAVALRLLHRNVAGVRHEERVRLLALLDVLVLHTVIGALTTILLVVGARPYLTPNIG